MLQLILGPSGSGKTTQIIQGLKSHAQNQQPCLLLVPEQFSSSAEMLVYRQLGDHLSAQVDVVSFRTLAERILTISGGIHQPVMNDAARAVYVRRALSKLEGKLTTFSHHRKDSAFCNLCAQTISELKTAGATPEILYQVSRTGQDPKLADISLIYAAYEAEIEGSAMDPEDKLALAAEQAGLGYFENKFCYIDNFDGFTAPEYGLIQPMLQHCKALTVALCCDTLEETQGGLGRYSPVRRTAHHLKRVAEQLGQPLAPIHLLEQVHRPQSPGTAAIASLFNEEGLSSQPAPTPSQTCPEGLWLTPAEDEWEETRQAAAEMHRLALAGVPYSKMALICRDIAPYDTPARRAFSLYGIPCFVDAPDTIEYTAPIAFFRAALGILQQGLVSQHILALLKTNLCGFSTQQLAALENYVYTWQPKAADWRNPFEKNPAGLLAPWDDTGKNQLDLAEQVRAALLPVLIGFIKRTSKKSASGLIRELYLLLDGFDAAQQVEAEALRLEQGGAFAHADRARRAWDLAMDLLDTLSLLLQDEALTPAELDDLLLILVRSTDFGQVPQTLEAVVFTSADRMRLADPEFCFVVGINEGEFPRQVGYSGLLTHTDRERLVENGVEMPGSFENRVMLEEMFYYKALTAPRRGLYLSCPARLGGAAKAPSASLSVIEHFLLPCRLEQTLARQAATPKAAFDLLCANYRENTPQTSSLYQALENAGGSYGGKTLQLLKQVENDGLFQVENTQLLHQLTRRDTTLSATRAERYYTCKFAYFLERILGVRPRQRAEFSPLESGTFVHYILEQVQRESGTGFPHKTDQQLEEMVQAHANVFIQQHLPGSTLRIQHTLERICKTTTALLCFLRDDAAQNQFQMDAVELPLDGSPQGVPPLEVVTPSGQTLRVTGKIDRVDVMRQDGKSYLRIIDYKTGDKKFNLTDVYCGLNMQMLIYMYTLCQNSSQRYPNAVPAGVLYLGSDPAPSTGSREGSDVPLYKMDGLLLEDPAILRAMEQDGKGLFIPVKYNKNGSPKAGKHLASLEKMGEIYRYVEKMLIEMVNGVWEGDFNAHPLVHSTTRPCDYCPYRTACRHQNGRSEKLVTAPADAFEPPPEPGTSPKEQEDTP